MRLVVDLIEYCRWELPRWNPISISGYHIREAGATAAQGTGVHAGEWNRLYRSRAQPGTED